VVSVLASPSVNHVSEELQDAQFISVMTDSSNHKHTEFAPSLIRYLVPQQGVQMKILAFANLCEKLSAQLTGNLVRLPEEAKTPWLFSPTKRPPLVGEVSAKFFR
jgi:hypothetical protein